MYTFRSRVWNSSFNKIPVPKGAPNFSKYIQLLHLVSSSFSKYRTL